MWRRILRLGRMRVACALGLVSIAAVLLGAQGAALGGRSAAEQDTTPPETEIVSGPPAVSASTTATFAFSSNEPAYFECSLDGQPFDECQSGRSVGVAEGPHTFEVRAIDEAGNVDPSPATWSWTVAIAPQTTITRGPPSSTSATSASFSFSSDDPAARFECSVVGVEFGGCTSPTSYSGLPRGSRRFEVRAIDPMGNADPTPATRSWTIAANGCAPDRVVNAGTLTLSDCVLEGLSSPGDGGAIVNTGTLTLRNVTIRNTTSGRDGGAIWNSGELQLENVTFSGTNNAGRDGGAIWSSGTITLTGVRMDAGSSNAGNAGRDGGAIWSGGTATVSNLTIRRSNAGQRGGGIWSSGRLTVTDSIIAIERANSLTGGGGLWNSGTAVLRDVTVNGNNTSTAGGGIWNGGELTLDGVTVSGNNAGGNGGGIANEGGTICCALGSPAFGANVTISNNNSGTNGGGLATYARGRTALLNATIVANNAPVGYGVFTDAASGSTTSLKNTLLVRSVPGTSRQQQVNCGGPVESLGHNLSTDTSCSLAAAGDREGVADPLLGPLQANEGTTFTHALLEGSPAIDAGSPDCPPPATDQRGIERPQGRRCDSGAFELEQEAVPALEVVLRADRDFGVVGRPSTIFAEVTNVGSTPIDGIAVTIDAVPAPDAKLASPECRGSAFPIVCDVPRLEPDARRTLGIVVEPADPGPHLFRAVARAADVEAEALALVFPVFRGPELDLDLDGEPSPTVGVGRTLTYTIDVENVGDLPAEDVEIEAELPEGLEILAFESTRGVCDDIEEPNIVCDIGALAPEEHVIARIETRPERHGPLSVRVVADSGDVPPARDEAELELEAVCRDETGKPFDEDGDALWNCWELEGLDLDGDGDFELDLQELGAKFDHKDVFVEIDAMAGHAVAPEAIATVVAAFADAPVANPDGSRGISLHVDNGPTSPMTPTETWSERSRAETLPHQELLGDARDTYDWSGFDAIKNARFQAARRPVFHYVVSAHRIDSSSPDVTLGLSRGIGASDVVFGLAPLCRVGDCAGPAEAQTGTFMHELGHNLGLRHGGNEDLHRKPNYVSIMNYSFALTGLLTSSGARFDYSRFGPESLGTLNENALNEVAGFNALNAALVDYRSFFFCRIGNDIVPVGPNVDWNCDGRRHSPDPVSEDINKDDELGTLTPFEDWSHLSYKGGAVGALQLSVPLPAVTEVDEPTLDELLETARVIAPALYDYEPPVTTAPVSPEPNAAGWHRTDAAVELRAADEAGGSGLRELVYSASGATTIARTVVPGGSATIPITAEGATTITFFAIDVAGNAEAPRQLTIRIDKSAPEAALQPLANARDVQVLGRDQLSGVVPGSVAMERLRPGGSRGGDDDDDDDEDGGEQRRYTVTDRAGNTLTLLVRVGRESDDEGGEVVARVLSFQYASLNRSLVVATPPANRLRAERDDGELSQTAEVGRGRARHRVRAEFDGRRTRITVEQGGKRTRETRAGLVLLRLVTRAGALAVEY